jgi:hypothetical protein
MSSNSNSQGCTKGTKQTTGPAGGTEIKHCPKCKSELRSGPKHEDICVKCEPVYLQNKCPGCTRILLDCICVRPSTWE